MTSHVRRADGQGGRPSEWADRRALEPPAPLSPQKKAAVCAALAVLYALLCFPLLQWGLELVPRRSLSGLRAPHRPPELELSTFVEGRFQKQAEEWFLKKNGLWGHLVRAGNEVRARLFSQVSSDYGSTVLLGREGQFFQPMYLKSFNRVRTPSEASVTKRARGLKRLEKLLAERGIAFTFLISTNVLALYPELIPPAYTDPSRDGRKNSYELLRPLLDRYRIPYVDAHELLGALKTEYPFRLFAPTGSHWNDVAACRVSAELARSLDRQLGLGLEPIRCSPWALEPEPRRRDRDLLEIANLFLPESRYRPTPYVKADPGGSAGGKKPTVLFVGTSFLHSITGWLLRAGVIDSHQLYFYYRLVQDHEGRSRPLRRRSIDWENDVFSHDAIVVEANVAGAGVAGFSFLWDSLRELQALRAPGEGSAEGHVDPERVVVRGPDHPAG